MEGNSKWTR